MTRQLDVDEIPGYPDYFLPAGMGLAYGIFSQGFVTYWPLEVVMFACLWAICCPLFNTWSYRAYSIEAMKLGMRPSRVSFVALKIVSTATLIFVVAFIVIGAKRLLATD